MQVFKVFFVILRNSFGYIQSIFFLLTNYLLVNRENGFLSVIFQKSPETIPLFLPVMGLLQAVQRLEKSSPKQSAQ
jgi:hypothetical protein